MDLTERTRDYLGTAILILTVLIILACTARGRKAMIDYLKSRN